MSQTRQDETPPRSMRHKRILDIAESQPDASMEEIAEAVPTATVDVVEEVLEEYGDPGEAEDTAVGDVADDRPAPEDLTARQRDALSLIYHEPEATQQEIAEALDVTAPTISNWVNDLDGFAWEDRVTYVESVFEEEPPMPTPPDDAADADVDAAENVTERLEALEARVDELAEATKEDPDAGDSTHAVEELRERVGSLECRIEGTEREASGSVDPTVVHNVIRACVTSDRVGEDEELTVVESLLDAEK